MLVSQVKLLHFRNYRQADVSFEPGLTFVCGKNAQGKTNLLESIYFCAIGKSPRCHKDKDLIMFGQNQAKIRIEVKKQHGKSSIEMILDKSAKKTVRINACTIHRIGDLLGNLTAVYFSPDELKLIKESPEYRRRFMDVSISQMSKTYFYLLLKYEKIIHHRNRLLKTAKVLNDILPQLDIFTQQAADTASKIIISRIKFIEKLRPILVKTHTELTGGKEVLEISYEGMIGQNILEIKEKLLKVYTQNIKRDFELRHTTIGPHRDDFVLTLNQIDVRTFGSQGQQRTAALSLKLSELEIFKEETDEYPVLLLDDVLSELDATRQKKLLNFCQKTQTILTCTAFPRGIAGNRIYIKQGEIICKKPV